MFLSVNSLIKDTQHCILKGHSWLSNLLEFLNIATNSFDEGNKLDVSYLDFNKIFDKVLHIRLILQLKANGQDAKLDRTDFLAENSWVSPNLGFRIRHNILKKYTLSLLGCFLWWFTHLCFGLGGGGVQ